MGLQDLEQQKRDGQVRLVEMEQQRDKLERTLDETKNQWQEENAKVRRARFEFAHKTEKSLAVYYSCLFVAMTIFFINEYFFLFHLIFLYFLLM